MSDTETSFEDELLKFLDDFQNKAWEALVHHKTQIQKIVFWTIGVVVSLAIATKVFGELDQNIAKSVRELLTSTEIILFILLSFIALLMFVIHHHLCSSFYITMIKYAHGLAESVRPEAYKLVDKIRSPYYLYQCNLIRRKHVFFYSVSGSTPGIVGAAIYCFLVAFLLWMLGALALESATFGSLRLNLSSTKAGTASAVFLTVLLLTISVVIERSRRKSRRQLKERFLRIGEELEKRHRG